MDSATISHVIHFPSNLALTFSFLHTEISSTVSARSCHFGIRLLSSYRAFLPYCSEHILPDLIFTSRRKERSNIHQHNLWAFLWDVMIAVQRFSRSEER